MLPTQIFEVSELDFDCFLQKQEITATRTKFFCKCYTSLLLQASRCVNSIQSASRRQ